MHILAVSDYILEDGVVCGATRVLHGYLNELHRQGATISLITLANPPFQKLETLKPNYIIHRVRKRFSINLEVDIKAACIDACQESIVDLCIGHLPFSAKYFFNLIRGKYPFTPLMVPFIYIFHSPWHLEFKNRISSSKSTIHRLWHPIGSFIRRYGERWVVLNADKIITLSSYMKKLLAETHNSIFCKPLGFKTEVIPPGVDYEQFFPGNKIEARKKLNLPEDRLIAFTARSLIPRCGISLALQAMAKAKIRHHEWLLLIAGEGVLRKQLEEETRKLALTKNVQFLGNLSGDMLTLYYQAADLFLLPSIDLEGFGLVILEAWASGLPVLGTPAGAIPEVLSPVTPELILKDCTPDTMFGALQNIADNPDELFATGKKCYEYVIKNYSWSKSTDQLLALFQQKS